MTYTLPGYILGVMDATVAANAERIELGLTGMTCAACAARIEKGLNRVPGVQAAVNFATETASVGYDPALTDPDQLLAAVARAGYGATVHRDPEADRARDQGRRAAEYAALKREFVVAALLTAPLLAQMVPMLAQMAPMLATDGWWSAMHADWLPRWVQLLLATPVQFWIGRRFYVGAWHALRGGGANMDVLVVLGTTMAFAFSAAVTLLGLHRAARLLRGGRRGHHARAARQAARGAREGRHVGGARRPAAAAAEDRARAARRADHRRAARSRRRGRSLRRARGREHPGRRPRARRRVRPSTRAC